MSKDKQKTFNIRVSSEEDFIRKYVLLISPVFKLTPTEIRVVAGAILNDGIRSSNRSLISKDSGIKSASAFSMCISRLAKKKALIKRDNVYKANPLMLPEDLGKIDSLNFSFVWPTSFTQT